MQIKIREQAKSDLTNVFLEFIKQQSVKHDIGISIKELDAGEGLPLAQVMEGIRSKYE